MKDLHSEKMLTISSKKKEKKIFRVSLTDWEGYVGGFGSVSFENPIKAGDEIEGTIVNCTLADRACAYFIQESLRADYTTPFVYLDSSKKFGDYAAFIMISAPEKIPIKYLGKFIAQETLTGISICTIFGNNKTGQYVDIELIITRKNNDTIRKN